MNPLSLGRRKIVLGVVLFLTACFVTLKVRGLQSLERDMQKHYRVDADIRTIAAELERLKSDTGDYPAAERPPIAANAATDPWGSDYIYRYPGKHHRNGYDLFSAGPDWRPDTPDDDWGQQ